MIGDFYKQKFNLEIGDLVCYKNKLYLIIDLSVQNDRIWWLEVESIKNNTISNIPAIYVKKV